MHKLWTRFDNNILKWSVIFTSLFVVLYPKLPSIHITYTWVYIRLEDFLISFVVLLWLVQLLRRKVKLALPVGIPILLYWVIGLASLIFSIVYIGPLLPQFFPKIAALEYARRIEYMVLFFVGFSTIQRIEDVRDYIIGLFVGLVAIDIYGLGQHFYLYIWNIYPKFFEHVSFCFPSFQTGNEEFAKGLPLCLPSDARVTSTFGGHYDLAGYLVLVLPILLAVIITIKKRSHKVLLGILFVVSLAILNFTSSRIAYPSYLIGVTATLIFLNRKKLILPVLAVSILFLFLFSQSTINRFLQTFRLTTIVLNNQGQVVGIAQNSLPSDLQKKIAKGSAIEENIPSQALPAGSSFITLAQTQVATSVAVVKKALSAKEAARLKLENGGLQLSEVSGSFHLQKALVYDISITTRLQAEWPNAIAAFLRNPLLGSGYSTITLATDNDYLRLLGESGILGLTGFLLIFIVLGIYLRTLISGVKNPMVAGYIYAIAGGVLGLFFYAILFDIFEASKVAESLWIAVGIASGALSLSGKKIFYFKELWKFFSSKTLSIFYLFLTPFFAFGGILHTFFVGDDFVWLKWAATSTNTDIKNYFLAANGFFYRPLDKTIMLLLYSVFAFDPVGYHSVILLLHGIMGIGVYLFGLQIFKQKKWAFLAAVLFLLLPVHGENIFWISSLSIDLGCVFILFGLISYIKAKRKLSLFYLLSVLFGLLALLSYELAVVIPLLIALGAIFLKKRKLKDILQDVAPFILLDFGYFMLRLEAHALSMNGDYSYNLSHLIQNVIGNVVGYGGLFLFGENFLNVYEMLRLSLKAQALPVAVLIVLAFGVAGWMVYTKKLWKYLFGTYALLVFSLCFLLVSLLPYLGLGNIAERYGYLASVGFVLFVCSLFERIALVVRKTPRPVIGIISVVFAIVVGMYFVIGNQKAMYEWQKTGDIAYNSLGYFKIEQENPSPKSTWYINNLPTRLGNAWIFPTGFGEGLWFLYRESEPQIIILPADTPVSHLHITTVDHIFTFDQHYAIHQTY